MNKLLRSIFAGFCASGLLAEADTEGSSLEVYATGMWESRYVDGGRDQLDGEGLLSAELGLAYGGFDLGVWAAGASDYREADFWVGYGNNLFGVDWYVSYTYLVYTPNAEDDDEFAAELSYELPLGLEIGADYTYSVDAEGGVLGASIARPVDLLEESLTLTPSIYYIWDFGYWTTDFDGPNSWQIQLDVEYALTDHWSVFAYYAFSFALEDAERDGFGDVNWGGLGVSYGF
ncbi:hypothetical protein [Coraliomargarita akajimensis]|uniref:Uncharacterized protein n=1 Tax=Coraliomargarita akajimensis (strain DSM 45221 / IAM 15411 / JCM 23193 / KCTC 12865 / 04OKA010-24) TaxID=583355 RepID=D5ER08_CORAD|nr:hypothetical protein [Coraliomargarita akajimensis]ADE54001.1 conserved hypothetical protein [Coraliomargarita akajimensis DSM 45221]